MVTYQLSLKVEREYIIASSFTGDELPTFTKGFLAKFLFEKAYMLPFPGGVPRLKKNLRPVLGEMPEF